MTSSRAEVVLWIALFSLQLAPVWALRWLPTQDGASHLENANILLELRHAERTIFRDYFAVNRRPTPNWLGHAVLAGLTAVFTPLIAEKVLLSIYLLALPLAVRAAFQTLSPSSATLAVLAFPLACNCLFHYGFYNFCLSIPLFFVVLGLWLRRGSRSATALLLVLLYACHVVSWVLALLALAIFARRRWISLAAAAVPSFAVALIFFAYRSPSVSSAPGVSLSARWNGLWHFSPAVFSYADLHQWAGAGLALFLAGLAFARIRRVPPSAIVFSAAVLLLYVMVPPQAFGGMVLLERLVLYFFFSLLLWIAAAPPPSAAARTAIQAGAAAFTLLLLALNVPWYRAANTLLDDFITAAPHIPANSAFLPLVYDPRGPGPLRDLYGEPLRHASGYIAVLRDAVNLDNYEAGTDLFPVVFRDDRNPAVFVGDIEGNPPNVRLDSPRIQSIVIWDPARGAPAPPPPYRLVFTSPKGYARVYQR